MSADPDDPLLVRVAGHAAEGERIMGQAVRRESAGRPLVALMRSLLLPRARPQQGAPAADIPRLLELVVPGFDDFLRHSNPIFRRPGTLLLPMSIRIPVLAGVSRVARRPADWAESLLGAVDQSALLGLAASFRELGANWLWSPSKQAASSQRPGTIFSFSAAYLRISRPEFLISNSRKKLYRHYSPF
jgi:hypothetical protein